MAGRSHSGQSGDAAEVLVALLETKASSSAGGAGDGDGAEDARPEIVLASPAVGLWRQAPRAGALITPGSDIGALEILGVLHPLRAPEGAYGIAELDHGLLEATGDLARRPVHHGQALLRLDPERAGNAAWVDDVRAATREMAEGELAFRAPMGGRFYSRPAPDKPVFVSPGDEVQVGATVGLLEVMKTFNRVTYGGADLPERARVEAVVPEDESDLAAGDVILLLEAIE